MPESEAPVRIVIADDHPIFREGLRRLLEIEPGFSVVGEAADGREAVERVAALKPDVLLLDLAMPRVDGLEALRLLAAADCRVRTVVLTASIEREESIEALKLGARGVVLKEAATQVLYGCIRAVVSGAYWVGHERLFDPVRILRVTDRGADTSPPPASRLTRRELDVISAIVEGATNKDIGTQFGLSEQTVKNHLSNIFDKLGVSNRLELALYAVHHRLLAVPPEVGAPLGDTNRTHPARPRAKPD